MEDIEIEFFTKWKLCRHVVRQIDLSRSEVLEILKIKLNESGSTQRGAEFRGSVQQSTFSIRNLELSPSDTAEGSGRVRPLENSKAEISIMIYMPPLWFYFSTTILIYFFVAGIIFFYHAPSKLILYNWPYVLLLFAIFAFGHYYVSISSVKALAKRVESALERWFP